MGKWIEIEHIQKGVAGLRLMRADKKNALSLDMMEEFISAIDQVKRDRENRILLLRSEGDCFCTGLDLVETSDPKSAERGIELYTQLLKALYVCPLITLSSICGYTIAGGVGVASVCDYVVAEEGTLLGFPEIQRGLVAAVVYAFLRRQLSERALKELFLFGEYISAQRGKEFGLVNEVVPREKVEETVQNKIHQGLLAAPTAVGHFKKLIEEGFLEGLFQDIEHAHAIHKVARSTKESIEGIRAFLDKKIPSWYPPNFHQ